jgi:endo-1,4-beta-D-glucanase Y
MKKIQFITCLGLAAGLTSLGLLIGSYSAANDDSSHEKYHVGPSSFQSQEVASNFWSQLLNKSWQYYKTKFMAENSSHVVSNTYGGTISEGQSYALMKSFWMNDPETFQHVWRWTQTHMKRPNDNLIGWRWGGENPASLIETENATDADQDIAYVLLLAGKKWDRPDYFQDGLALTKDIWRYNVSHLHDRYFLKPGTWSGFKLNNQLALNPSYMAPYVYQTFAQYDEEHADGWKQLAEDTYETLEACSNLSKVNLAPNWCAISTEAEPSTHGKKRPLKVYFSDVQGAGARDFSYDAFRVFWRMEMDSKLSPSPGRERAKDYLKKHGYLLTYWEKHSFTPEGFTENGQPRTDKHSGFSAGGTLTVSHAMNPHGDSVLYESLLGQYYNPEGYWFNDYNDFLHSVIWLHLYAISL